MGSSRDDVIVGLDIGTTKVSCIIGHRSEGGIDIIGIGSAKSDGLRKGVVVNIDSTVKAIQQAVSEAELMSGHQVVNVFVGIAGGHIKGLNSRGVVAIGKDREVSDPDIDRVIDAARAVAIPMDRQVIHILPQEYVIDDNDGVREPIGMSGVRLEAKVHIVTAQTSCVSNIIKCCNRANLNVQQIVLEQLASAEAVLLDEEKEVGVVLVDIGGGTSDIAIYHNNAIVHTAVVALGGNHVSSDIAVGLRTPRAEAERIKIASGCATRSLVTEGQQVEVPGVGGRGRTQSREMLCEIIEPRVEEIYMLIQQEIHRSGFEDLIGSGIVLTGGSSLMEGMGDLAEEVFGMPVRIGRPENVGGLVDVVKNPRFATGVGLVAYGLRGAGAERMGSAARNASQSGQGIFGKLKGWFKKVV